MLYKMKPKVPKAIFTALPWILFFSFVLLVRGTSPGRFPVPTAKPARPVAINGFSGSGEDDKANHTVIAGTPRPVKSPHIDPLEMHEHIQATEATASTQSTVNSPIGETGGNIVNILPPFENHSGGATLAPPPAPTSNDHNQPDRLAHGKDDYDGPLSAPSISDTDSKTSHPPEPNELDHFGWVKVNPETSDITTSMNNVVTDHNFENIVTDPNAHFFDSMIQKKSPFVRASDNETLQEDANFKGECFPNDAAVNAINKTLPMCPFSEAVNRDVICYKGQQGDCVGRCGLKDFENSCSCLPICKIYKTCCSDYTRLCETQDGLSNFQGREIALKNKVTCSSLTKAVIISECPGRGFGDRNLVQECERTDLASAGAIFPVTDSFTGHQFKNLACWKCWHMSGDNLFWNARFYFDSSFKPNNQYRISSYLSLVAQSPFRSMWIPPTGYEKQVCDICSVKHCSGCENTFLQDQCASHIDLVTIDEVTYQNEYCYRCSKKRAESYLLRRNCSHPRTYHLSDVNPYLKDNPFDMFVVEVNVSTATNTVSVYQKESTGPDQFTWREMHCGLYEDECTPTSCKLPRVLMNGRCDNEFRYFTGLVQVCVGFENSSLGLCRQADETVGVGNATVKSMMADIGLELKNYSHTTLVTNLTMFNQEGDSLRFNLVLEYPLTSEGYDACHTHTVDAVSNVLWKLGVQEKSRVCLGCRLSEEKLPTSSLKESELTCVILNMSQSSQAWKVAPATCLVWWFSLWTAVLVSVLGIQTVNVN